MKQDRAQAYVLESSGEYDRLERQSRLPQYDFRVELAGITATPGQRILDAGCGSGIVARHLAQSFPDCRVEGCDLSAERVLHAQKTAQNISNLEFSTQDLCSLSFPSASFDRIICRYVLHHLTEARRRSALAELFRCLKPRGRIRIVEMDGLYLNLFPQPPLVKEVFALLTDNPYADFRAGAKTPSLLFESGFTGVRYDVQSIQIDETTIQGEIEMIESRFEQTRQALTSIVGSEAKALEFESQYLETLKKPGSVLYYTKFIVDAERPATLRVLD